MSYPKHYYGVFKFLHSFLKKQASQRQKSSNRYSYCVSLSQTRKPHSILLMTLRDLCVCPCFGSRGSEEAGEDLNPVLLVSGMGGSILHSKRKKLFGLETRVWVRILFSDLEFRNKIWSLYNPKTGTLCFYSELASHAFLLRREMSVLCWFFLYYMIFFSCLVLGKV